MGRTEKTKQKKPYKFKNRTCFKCPSNLQLLKKTLNTNRLLNACIYVFSAQFEQQYNIFNSNKLWILWISILFQMLKILSY